jgi:hypothetical protein
MGTTITVSTSAELYAALAQVTGGETILLSAGDYGALTMNGRPGFPNEFNSNITITSADPENPAVFDWMDIHGGRNITVDNVVLDYTFSEGDPDWTRPFEVNDSQNVNITNTVFDGDMVLDGVASSEGYGFAYGLSVRDSTDVVIEGNEFFGFGRAAIFSQSDDIVVRDNDIHSVRSDGLNFVQVQNVLIEDNHIHDFVAAYDSEDHRDMIQFWTNGTTEPSTDIIIRNNVLDMGEGSWTQTIFMRNESVDSQGGGQDMYYQNVRIEGNTIYNGHLHGITVGETDGLVIRNNSLVTVEDPNNAQQDGSLVWVPQINVNVDATSVIIQSNITSGITGENGQSGWLVANNALIQSRDASEAGYYDDVFVTSSRTVGEDGHHFVVRPGSLLDVMNVGTPEFRAAPDLDTAGAVYQVEASGQDGNTHTFDAGLTAQMLADVGIEGASYHWTFGDGTTAEGLEVTHEFIYSGGHDVRLTVTLEDGQVFTAGNTVAIRGGNVLSFDGAVDTTITAYGFGDERELGEISALNNGAIVLGTSDPASISRDVLGGIRGSDALTIDFTLAGEGAGDVMRMHMSFFSKVTPEGALVVQMYNDAGESFLVTTSGAQLNDGAAHDISIQLEDGALRVFIDGELSGATEFSGTLPETGNWDLVFGNPWNQGADFNGSITELEVNAGEELPPIDSMLGVSTSQGEIEGQAPPAVVISEAPEVQDFAEIKEEPAQAPALEEDINTVGAGREFPTVSQDDVLGDAQMMIAQAERVALDGDHVQLGRLREFEDSGTLGFTVEFTNDGTNEDGRLVWNHMKLGLTIKDDEIMVNAATKDQGFQHFTTEGLGLSQDTLHTATVLIDSDTDRLQVIVDDTVVIDVDDVDFDHVGAGGHEWGWSVGTEWGHAYEGDISSLIISDQITFEDDTVVLNPGTAEV